MSSTNREPYSLINLFDWSGGIRNRRRNPLAFPQNAFMAGENVDLTDGILSTRAGLSATSVGSLPYGEVVSLRQIRFPTNEVSYLLAQVKTPAVSGGAITGTWTQKADGPTLFGHSAIWDSPRNRMVIFGGGHGDPCMQSYSNCWAYCPDTDTWEELTTTGGPPDPRLSHTAIYDAVGQRMIVFGGQRITNSIPVAYYDDVWALDLATLEWTELTCTGSVPGVRRGHTAICRGADRTMIVCGGSDELGDKPSAADLYVLDLVSLEWTVITNTSGNFPSARNGHTAVYDQVQDRMLIFAGTDGETTLVDCWVTGFDGQWTERASAEPIFGESGTYPDGSAAVLYQGMLLAAFAQIVVDDDPENPDPFEYCLLYDPAANIWSAPIIGGDEPGMLMFHVMVITDEGLVIVHGGQGGSETYNDTRVLTLIGGATPGTNGLYASPTHLPVTLDGEHPVGAEFTPICDLGENAGPISVAVLNDRAVITEGKAKPPLVWGGCMDSDSPSDWMYPKAVLISQDGIHFYDVTQHVCDSDPDSVAQIGGIRVNGYLAICCDMPRVKGFYFEMQSPNQGAGGAGQVANYTGLILFSSTADMDRQDLKATIDHWVQDSGATGHFENASNVALTLGPGNDCPDIEKGVLISFPDGNRTIINITGNGSGSGDVELSSEHADATVSGASGVDIMANAYDMKAAIDQWYQDVDTGGHFEAAEQDLDNAAVVDMGGGRVMLPAAGHGLSPGDHIRVYGTTNYSGSYFVEATTTSAGIVITHSYAAETLGGTAKFRKRLTLGSGNDCPDISTGSYVEFMDGTLSIDAITSEGEQDNEVQLSEVHSSANVMALYDAAASNNGISVNHIAGTPVTLMEKTPLGGYVQANYPKTSIRQILSANEITVSGTGFVCITIKSGQLTELGPCEIAHCSIVERDGATANGTTTPTTVTFKGGQAAVSLSPNEEIVSDDIPFDIDETKSYLVSLDLSYKTVTVTQAHQGYPIGTQRDVAALAVSSGYGYYYKSWDLTDADACYNEQTVTGIWKGVGGGGLGSLGCLGVTKLESKTAHPIPAAMFVSHTTDHNQFDISLAEDFVGVDVLQNTPGSSTAWHMVSSDARQTFKVWYLSAWRETVRYGSGAWQYKDGSDLWQNASANTLLQALRQAFAVPVNRMTEDELEAITSEQWKAYGGIILHQGTLDFAQALQADGNNYPSVNGYRIIYGDMGTTVVEGWKSGSWEEGDEGWTDNTIVGNVPLARSGSIIYGGKYYEGDYKVLSEVPGFWWRFKTNGTSINTAITRILYKAPCQLLANIGDGQPNTPLGFIFHDTSKNLIRDYTVEVSDYVQTELSKADVPMTVEDCLYVGYLTEFSEIEVTPFQDNNQKVASLAAAYWNGEAWLPFRVVDGTSMGGKTLSKKGKISFTIPDDWKMSIPLEARFPRGFWLRFNVSAELSANAAISEVRVYAVPDPVVKHKFAVAAKDRIALLGRPDAPDQCDLSRGLEEYGFSGADSASYRIGGMDAIQCAFAAWDGLFVGKTETWHQLIGNSVEDFYFQGVEAARHVPVNSRVIVKAPLSAGDGGGRYGMFYLNRFGAFISTGLHTDSAWNTGRSAVLSDSVTWWDEQATVRLDLKNLHIACGEYWPVRNWVIWSVPMTTDGTPQAFNNRLIIYDLTLQAWLPPFSISVASLSCVYHHAAQAPGYLGEIGLYGGDYAGRILRLFGPTDATDLGEPVKAWVETGWLHMGSPQWLKLIRRVQLYGQTQPERNVTIKIWKDGNTNPAKPDKTVMLADLAGDVDTFFSREEQSANVQGRFFKFRIEFADVTQIFGLQIGFSLIREWGAV